MSDVPPILLVLHDVNSCQASVQIFICRDRLKQCFGYRSAESYMVFVVAELKIPGLELIDHNWSFIMSLNVMQVFLTLTNFLALLELQIFSDGPVPWTGDKRQLWNEVKIHIQGYLRYEPGTVITSIFCLMQFK
jgi:hypothetical protein